MHAALVVEDRPTGRQILFRVGIALLLIGLFLLILAQALPSRWLGEQAWTADQAVEHQRISGELHRLSFAAPSNKAAQQQLRDIRLEFADIDLRLRDATSAADRFRSALRWWGMIGCCLGAIGALATRSDY